VIRKISITKFNTNISKYIRMVRDGKEVIYLTHRGRSKVVMLPKTLFDNLMKEVVNCVKHKNEARWVN